jgi:acetyl-CoA carboxylase carboxyltransferase component
MNKRTLIEERILEGNATRQDLMEAASVDSKGLASQFTYMRLTGKCPVVDADGIFSIVTQAEWDEMKAEKAANAKPTKESTMTPEERLTAAEARVEKCAAAAKAAAERFNKNTVDAKERELKLRSDLADIQLELAKIALAEVE